MEYEKLGAFYLGRAFDHKARKLSDETILYDSRDLNTHALIIGMTGSGKTGLGIALLEEALMDNIPVVAIDPKGDLPCLALTFDQLRPADFTPWINAQDATTNAMTTDQYAAAQAKLWRKGLAEWDQGPERIARLKAAAKVNIYTPGSSSGLPVSMLRSFNAPSPAVMADADLLRELINSSVTGLLALLGIEADPFTSREHILLSNVLESHWSKGSSLDLPGLIQAIQAPPFARIGVMDLEAVYPASDRFGLAMRLNNLLASPGFEAWMEGAPLDMAKMLYSPEGKAQASIFSISHLSEPERMFFVTMLLNAMLSWMRNQQGTSSLRALLYMDEIFGYFPPVKNPPSKTPLLRLLKQARAFGLGAVLSTQNPVDLDYKGLANIGTWFIGRLQTERDQQRVLDGLQSAATAQAQTRQELSATLSALGSRTFYLHNVHDAAPVIFQTRWVLSYLRGPLRREDIRRLNQAPASPAGAPSPPAPAPASAAPAQAPAASAPAQAPPAPQATAAAVDPTARPRPVLPPDIQTYYLPPSGTGNGLIYYPAVAGWLDIHFSNRKHKVDTTVPSARSVEVQDGPIPVNWEDAEALAQDPAGLLDQPAAGAAFAELPAAATKARSYGKWQKEYLRWMRQNNALTLHYSRRFKLTSGPEESEAEFRARLAQAIREKRDLQIAKLRKRYKSKFTTLDNRLMRAQQALAREQEQAKSKKMETVISFGSAILGAFMGRKVATARSASRMGTAMKSAGRLRKEKMDVGRAQETAAAVQQQMEELQIQMQEEIEALELEFDPGAEPLEQVRVKPKTTDLSLKLFALVWLPFRRDLNGRLSPDWQ